MTKKEREEVEKGIQARKKEEEEWDKYLSDVEATLGMKDNRLALKRDEGPVEFYKNVRTLQNEGKILPWGNS